MWYAHGLCLGFHAHIWVPDEWRGKVPDLHAHVPEDWVWESIYDLGFPVGRYNSRPACYPPRRLDLERLGWGSHVLLGKRTMDCSGKRIRGCVGGRTAEEV